MSDRQAYRGVVVGTPRILWISQKQTHGQIFCDLKCGVHVYQLIFGGDIRDLVERVGQGNTLEVLLTQNEATHAKVRRVSISAKRVAYICRPNEGGEA